MDDFGDAVLLGDNGATQHFRVDWLTPEGLSTWGDGRTFLIGTKGYIELRKYCNVGTKDGSSNHVFLVNEKGEQHFEVTGMVGYPYFGQLIPWNVKAETCRANGFPVEGGNKKLIDQLQKYYESIPDLPYEGHTGEIDDILTALEKGTRPMITGVDGRKTVELITAVYKAGCLKQFVGLPLEKNDAE